MSQRFIPKPTRTKSSYLPQDFSSFIGKWISFQTPFGDYRGIVEKVRGDAVLIKLPAEYSNSELVHYVESENLQVELAGGYPYPHPYPKPYPWCWYWVPFAVIIIFTPWFFLW